MTSTTSILRGMMAAALTVLAAAAAAETRPTLNFYGVSGLIDMPSAESQPDGELSATIAGFGPNLRNTLSFQALPRMQASFRYQGVRGLAIGGFGPNDTYYDRSFDLRFRVLDEGRWRPAVTVGLQDFVGTGNFSAEYIVATKHLNPRLKVTAGIGWGRLGSYKPIGTPFGPRPGRRDPTGGTPNPKQWFKGPAALFGGVEWQVNDRLGLKVEYSSDAYGLEVRRGIMNRRSPLNFGAEYQVTERMRVGAYYLYGSEIGVSVQFALNPRKRITTGIVGAGPLPVVLRPDRARAPEAWDTAWASDAAAPARLRSRIEKRFALDGLVVESLAVEAGRAELRIRNPRYDAAPQAIGRAARAMSAVLPASVEVFDIVPVVNGIGASRIRLMRSDIEALEHDPDGAALLRQRAQVLDAGPRPALAAMGEGLYPRFSWQISPYTRNSLFDPENPYRIDVGLRFAARFDIAPGLFLSGSVTQKLAGNLDEARRRSNSVLPRVRSESNRYNRVSTAVEHLTIAWYNRPGPNLYGRVTAGYLERHFGGVSGELLWKRPGSPFALGVEINYARQRDFDQKFGFRPYGVTTGHVSAYYAFGNGFHGQLDVGRYLAGDWGATLSIDREFANGWRVGAFATLTDVPFRRFGEGSFDKGIRLTIPLNWAVGTSTRVETHTTIRPVLRDGGARLDVNGRLYETVRGYHARDLDAQWGRVWR
jgi:hypothetical protein